MSYIGNKPATAFETVQKQISTSNSGTTITLDRAVTSVQDILLTIDAVVQSYDNYSVSGTTLTVGGTLNNNRVEILYVGRTMQSVDPTDDSVSASKIKTDAVTTAKVQNDAITVDKLNLISTSSVPSLEAKGDGSSVAGKIKLNCHVNSHGVTLQSPDHSSSQSWTLKLPDNSPTADKFLKVKSITGSGSTATGQLEFADAGLSNWSENSGNLLPSNASYGIYLGTNSANSSSNPANLLNDYETGTFNTAWSVTGATLNAVNSHYGAYTKIGTMVIANFGANITTSSGTPTQYQMTALPFQSDGAAIGSGFEFGQTTTLMLCNVADNSSTAVLRKYDGGNIASAYLQATLVYRVD